MENRFLFRAKRKDNGEWTEGFLLKRWDGLWIFSIDEKFADLIIPSTLCQCTGLKDTIFKRKSNGMLIVLDLYFKIQKHLRLGLMQ